MTKYFSRGKFQKKLNQMSASEKNWHAKVTVMKISQNLMIFELNILYNIFHIKLVVQKKYWNW